MDNVKGILIISIIAIIVLVGLFIGIMAFTWRSDVSKKEPYSYFLNTPLTIKQACIITKSEGRFKEFSLNDYNPKEKKENPSIKKVYKIGDKIEFYAAKSFYSIHVGTSIYLIGKSTLDNGEIIEFEYYWSDYSPRIWESIRRFFKEKRSVKYTQLKKLFYKIVVFKLQSISPLPLKKQLFKLY